MQQTVLNCCRLHEPDVHSYHICSYLGLVYIYSVVHVQTKMKMQER